MVHGSSFVKPWMQVLLLLAVALAVLLIFGPMIGGWELLILAALVVAGVVLIRRRSRTKGVSTS